jgi:hypothetical protein
MGTLQKERVIAFEDHYTGRVALVSFLDGLAVLKKWTT